MYISIVVGAASAPATWGVGFPSYIVRIIFCEDQPSELENVVYPIGTRRTDVYELRPSRKQAGF